MRLIDADKLYEDLANNLRFVMGDGTDGAAIDLYSDIGNVIHDTFANQPTAFDVDKVVEQLKKRMLRAREKESENVSEYFEGEADGFEFAIKIVKTGGIDE